MVGMKRGFEDGNWKVSSGAAEVRSLRKICCITLLDEKLKVEVDRGVAVEKQSSNWTSLPSADDLELNLEGY